MLTTLAAIVAYFDVILNGIYTYLWNLEITRSTSKVNVLILVHQKLTLFHVLVSYYYRFQGCFPLIVQNMCLILCKITKVLLKTPITSIRAGIKSQLDAKTFRVRSIALCDHQCRIHSTWAREVQYVRQAWWCVCPQRRCDVRRMWQVRWLALQSIFFFFTWQVRRSTRMGERCFHVPFLIEWMVKVWIEWWSRLI